MSGGILNPPETSAACLRMIGAVRQEQEAVESVLSTTILDRETYLQRMGEVLILRKLRENLERIYRETFEV